MAKKLLVFLAIISLSLVNISSVSADHIGAGDTCDPAAPHCISGYSCVLESPITKTYSCKSSPASDVPGAFGKIEPPEALKNLVGADPSGTKGLSIFFSRLVSLMYALAGLVLILMLVWGAWDWLTSEGDKEKLQSAQRKIINAIIGIVLFAAAFAIIELLQTFTGFSFFQK